jgi:multisubunit Na+/H+ antiporter MnhC subunit
MRRELEWSYRMPPVQPLWKRMWEGFEPIAEALMLTGCVVSVWYLAFIVTAL